jgi:hypothetical protein
LHTPVLRPLLTSGVGPKVTANTADGQDPLSRGLADRRMPRRSDGTRRAQQRRAAQHGSGQNSLMVGSIGFFHAYA